MLSGVIPWVSILTALPATLLPLQHRPLEQYPEEEDDMARYMRETGVAAKLRLPQRNPLAPSEVQKALEARITAATVSSEDGMGMLLRSVTQVGNECNNISLQSLLAQRMFCSAMPLREWGTTCSAVAAGLQTS